MYEVITMPYPLAFLLILSLLLAACGQSDVTPPTEASESESVQLDVCTLLTGSEIETHVGQAPGAAESAMFGLIPTCTWPSADGSEPQILHLSVARRGGMGDYEGFLADQRATWGEDFSPDDYEKFDIGDFAVWQDDAMFFVFTDEHQITMGGSLRDGLPSKEACEALGRLAVTRLP